MKKIVKAGACVTAALCMSTMFAACTDDTGSGGNFVTDGVEKAQDSDFLEEGTGLRSGQYTLEFPDGTDGYGVEIRSNGETMFRQASPVVITVASQQGLIGIRESELASGYDSVERHEYGLAASARVESQNGSVFQVSDLWFISAEGVFNLSRNIEVESSAGGETGFSSQFTIGSASGRSDMENYDVTLPSLVYRDSSNIPSGAIGANLDVESLFAKETRMGLPYVFIRDKSTGDSVAVSHYQPEVSVGGIVGGGTHGEANENFRYGSLGYVKDALDGMSAGFVYPCKEGPVSYSGSGWTSRFHPVTVGVEHRYKLSVIPQADTEYNNAFTYATLKAYGSGMAELFDADLDMLYSVSFELLSELYNEYHDASGTLQAAGLPFAVPLDDDRPGFSSPSMQMGFVGAQTSLAAQMIKVGYETDDTELVRKGSNMIDFWTTDTSVWPQYNPLPYVWWDPLDNNANGGGPRMTAAGQPYPGFLRILCDGMDGVMEAYKYAQAGAGTAPAGWINAVTKVADFFYEKQQENGDGSLFRAYDVRTGAVNTDTSDASYQGSSKLNTASVVPFFYKVSDYYDSIGDAQKSKQFSDAAKWAVDYVYDNIYSTLGKYVGGTIDQHNIVDKEAGIFAMRAFTSAYIATRDQKYLTAAENAGCFVLSFIYAYDFAVPCASATQDRYNPFREGGASGFSIIATGHSSSDIFGAYTVYDFYKLYLLTENEAYKDIATFIEYNSKQAVDYDGRFGFLYAGTMPEASGLAEFNYSTVDTPGIWLPWNTDACVRPMSDLETMFGEYDIGKISLGFSEQQERLFAYGLGGKIVEQ